MELSQSRSANVLEYVLRMNDIGNEDIWLRNMMSSVGYSSSRLIYEDTGAQVLEDKDASRRVAFRILTNGEQKLNIISQQNS